VRERPTPPSVPSEQHQTDSPSSITLTPLTRNPMEGQGNRFFWLDGERKSASSKHNADVLAAPVLGNHLDAGRVVFVRRILAT
jgi:hypothetical protein